MYVAPLAVDRRPTTQGLRVFLAALTAALFVIASSLTSFAFIARETVFDARAWTDNRVTRR